MFCFLALPLVLMGSPFPGPTEPEGSAHFDSAPQAITFDEAIGLPGRLDVMVRREQALRERAAKDKGITGAVSQPQLLMQPGMRVQPAAERSFALQAMLTQSWSLARLGRARRYSATLERDTAAAQLRADQLQRKLAAAKTWIDLRTAQDELALARREQGVAQLWVERAEAGLAAELLLATDVALARAYAAEVESRALGLEGRVHDLGLALAREVSATPGRPLAATGSIPEPDLPAENVIAEAFSQLDRLPEVQAQRLHASALVAYGVEQRIQYRGAQITAGGAMDRDAPGSLLLYGVIGFSFPTRGLGARQEGIATLEARQHGIEATDRVRTLTSTLATVRHDLHHTQIVVDNLTNNLIPQLQAGLAAHTQAQAEGEGTIFALLDARRRLLAAQTDLVVAKGDNAWAKVQSWMFLAEIGVES